MVGEEGDAEPVFGRERDILLQRLVFILRKYPGLQVLNFCGGNFLQRLVSGFRYCPFGQVFSSFIIFFPLASEGLLVA